MIVGIGVGTICVIVSDFTVSALMNSVLMNAVELVTVAAVGVGAIVVVTGGSLTITGAGVEGCV